jgi:hypothetical protein
MICDINIYVIIIWIALFGIFDTIISTFKNIYIKLLSYFIIGIFGFIAINYKI